MRVVSVKWIKDYLLEVTFDNGKIRIANFRYFLFAARNPMTTQFRDIKKFKKVKIDHGDLSWKDEMDFEADSIWEGEFLQMEITDLKELKHTKEILSHALKMTGWSEEERLPVKGRLAKVIGYIEKLQSYRQNPATARLKLKIAEITNVGIFVLVVIKQLYFHAEQTVVKLNDQPDIGFKTEILMGANGQTFLKITDHHTPEYNRFYKVLDVLNESPA